MFESTDTYFNTPNFEIVERADGHFRLLCGGVFLERFLTEEAARTHAWALVNGLDKGVCDLTNRLADAQIRLRNEVRLRRAGHTSIGADSDYVVRHLRNRLANVQRMYRAAYDSASRLKTQRVSKVTEIALDGRWL